MDLRPMWGVALAVALVGCGGSFNQGLDPDINDDSGEADDGTDASDSADGTDGADGSDGSDGTEPGPCTHAYHPIHETGWSKSFAATFNGDSGTATEEGLGPVGDDVYAYRDIIATASNSFDVQVTAGCDYAGEGMFTLDWAGSFTLNGLLTGQISANLQPHRQYLPPEYAIGSSGSWEYSYQNQMEWAFDGEEGTTPATVTFTGVYSELGFESYTLPTGESVQAYKLINEYTTSGDLFGAPIPQEGYIEQWWVKGLGLVKEVSYDNADPSTPLMTKTLSSFTGLTPE